MVPPPLLNIPIGGGGLVSGQGTLGLSGGQRAEQSTLQAPGDGAKSRFFSPLCFFLSFPFLLFFFFLSFLLTSVSDWLKDNQHTVVSRRMKGFYSYFLP